MYKSIPNNYAKQKVQRVYPNTHCSGIDKLKGLQWSIQTLPFAQGQKKYSAQLLEEEFL